MVIVHCGISNSSRHTRSVNFIYRGLFIVHMMAFLLVTQCGVRLKSTDYSRHQFLLVSARHGPPNGSLLLGSPYGKPPVKPGVQFCSARLMVLMGNKFDNGS